MMLCVESASLDQMPNGVYRRISELIKNPQDFQAFLRVDSNINKASITSFDYLLQTLSTKRQVKLIMQRLRNPEHAIDGLKFWETMEKLHIEPKFWKRINVGLLMTEAFLRACQYGNIEFAERFLSWYKRQQAQDDLLHAILKEPEMKLEKAQRIRKKIGFGNGHGSVQEIFAIALETAVVEDHVAIARLLLVHNLVDVNENDNHPMFLAITYDRAEIVELLLKYRANINDETLFSYAIKVAGVKVVSLLIENGANINYDGGSILTDILSHENYPLFLYIMQVWERKYGLDELPLIEMIDKAIIQGNRKIVKRLEQYAHYLNIDLDYYRLIQSAISFNDAWLVQQWLEKVELDQETKNRFLFVGIVEDYLGIVKLMLKNGADPNAYIIPYSQPGWAEYQFLKAAVQSGNFDIVRELIRNGAKAGQPVLNFALMNGKVDTYELIWNDIVSTLNQEKRCANFIQAAVMSRHEIVEWFVEILKIDLHRCMEQGLFVVIIRKQKFYTISYLLDKLHLNWEQSDNQHSLSIMALDAARYGGYDILKLFLDSYPLLLVNPDRLSSMFSYAVKSGDIKSVRLLLTHNPVVKNIDKLLKHAARKGDKHIVEILLKLGADPNMNGEPLLQASRRGFVGTVATLLAHGADPSMKNEAAIKEAEINRHADTLRLLKDNLPSRDMTLQGYAKRLYKGLFKGRLSFKR